MSVFEDIELDVKNNSIELSSHVNKIRENSKSSPGMSRNWSIFGNDISKEFVKYLAQLIILYLLICTSLCMLILAKHEDKAIWSSLLGSSFGLLIQGPRLKKDKIKQ